VPLPMRSALQRLALQHDGDSLALSFAVGAVAVADRIIVPALWSDRRSAAAKAVLRERTGFRYCLAPIP